MRVLIVNQYVPPDTSATARMVSELADALIDHGHQVRIVAGRPSYDPTERHAWRPWRRDGVTVRLGSTAFDRRRPVGRVLNYLTYLALALPAVLLRRADVIVAMTDPPLAVAVALLGSRGRPVLYNVRDLHPEFAEAARLVRSPRILRVWGAVHRWCLRAADAVVALGDDMAGRIRAHGVDGVQVIRDGARPPAERTPDPAVVDAVRRGLDFVAVHAGNLGFGGAWATLLDAARDLEDGSGFVLVGEGAEAQRLEARRPPNVWFSPFQPDVGDVMAAGDLQIVTVADGLDGIIVPSKLYGVLAHGRPVLAVAPAGSDVAAIVAAAECGYVCDPTDPAAVAAAMAAARRDPEALAAMGANAARAAASYDRDRCLSALVTAIASRADGPAEPGEAVASEVMWRRP